LFIIKKHGKEKEKKEKIENVVGQPSKTLPCGQSMHPSR
jgi:hypothetical protein